MLALVPTRTTPLLRKLLVPGLCGWLMTACGGAGKTAVAPAPPASPPTTLTGNWMIAGSRAMGTLPLLSTTLVVNGSQITGQGTVQIRCSATATAGGSISLAGTIAADGTFQSTYSLPEQSGEVPPFSYAVSLSGSSPTAAGAATWNGTYQVTTSGTLLGTTVPCATSQSGAFAAKKLAPLTGVYTGVQKNNAPPETGPVPATAFAVTVAQGEPTLVMSARRTDYQLPLAATVTVTGTTCFHSGTTVGSASPSSISGDRFALQFVMDDGSQMGMDGYLDDATGTSLQATAVVLDGACKGSVIFATLLKSQGS